MKFKCPSCGGVVNEYKLLWSEKEWFTDEELSNDESILPTNDACQECARNPKKSERPTIVA